jgi:hypothetical protein
VPCQHIPRSLSSCYRRFGRKKRGQIDKAWINLCDLLPTFLTEKAKRLFLNTNPLDLIEAPVIQIAFGKRHKRKDGNISFDSAPAWADNDIGRAENTLPNGI